MADNSFDSLFSSAERFEGKLAKIKCVGVGGGGGNAINHMVESGIDHVDFFAVNTDAQDLGRSNAPYVVQVGEKITKGLGVGGNPVIGKAAAEESVEQLRQIVLNTDLLFITAGMGGGTGTGVAPELARIAKETCGDDILVVGVVTRPFACEGLVCAEKADGGIKELQKYVDAIIIVPNDNIYNIIDSNTPISVAYKKVDEVLYQAVKGISDVIIKPGQQNIDFNDLKSIMLKSGHALVGIGQAKGNRRQYEALQKAIGSPLVEENDIMGAKGFIVSFSANDMTMTEQDEIMKVITKFAASGTTPMFGYRYDKTLPKGVMSITVIATGLEKDGLSRLRGGISSLDNYYGDSLTLGKEHLPSPYADIKRESPAKRNSDMYSSNSDFVLIPAFLRRGKEEK